MSRGYNKVILMGNLARDPEMRQTTSGQKMARFSIACGREWKDKQTGEKKTDCDFIPCQAWGVLADLVDKYCKKGKPVLIEGRIQVRQYDDSRSGEKRWATDVIVNDLTLLSSSEKSGGNSGNYGGYPASSARPAATHTSPAPSSLNEEIDEFPLDIDNLDGENEDVPF